MKLSLSISSFDWPGGPGAIRPRLGELACTAEEAGYDSLWVMDHFFQIRALGPVDDPMLEAYTTLGFLAGQTQRVKLGALVTGVTYRHPGVLIKQVTTLDVLSGGRAYFGIGAGWFEREHLALGVPFPALKERFERLEETLQIAHQMWDPATNDRYEGKHYRLAETLCEPPPISQPHPPILVGGGGEKKTLRFVAQYGDACNLFDFGGPRKLVRKLDVLKQHCDAVGRDYATIDKTVMTEVDPGPNGERVDQVVEQLTRLERLGFQTVLTNFRGIDRLRGVKLLGERVLPRLTPLGAR
jgi:F420-dependent oxidoreductase-like protein